METLMQQDGMYACVVKGERHDIGTPQEFIKTITSFGLHIRVPDGVKPRREQCVV